VPHPASTSDPVLLARVLGLERALRRTRAALLGLGVLLLLLVVAAWRAAERVEARELVLTDAGGSPLIVLEGRTSPGGPALALETPAGVEIMVLGGEAIRRVR
jgi:hypothetical protein